MKSFSVRKIIAIIFTLTFCYLALVGNISKGDFIPIFSMVIGYYFGKSTALDIPGIIGKDLNNSEKENNDKN